MKIVILGATGPTGQELVKQSLQYGYEVYAVVRDPSPLHIRDINLTIIRTDVLNELELIEVFKGKDAVLSALGTGKDLRSDFISKAMKSIIPAMYGSDLNRIIFLSSFGVGETKKQAPLLSKIFFSTLLKKVLLDKDKADSLLKSSNLNYTLVYPTRLSNGRKTRSYSVSDTLPKKAKMKISRADVADFMLEQLKNPSWYRRVVIITGGPVVA